ncbi:MAG: hypothetical protein KH434_00700 [Clostridium sp.]|nr:hypothetical protein [Clostridium sp.]
MEKNNNTYSNNDFFNLVFEKMEDADAFCMKDEELARHRMENNISSDKLYEFIKENVDPSIMTNLFMLLEKRNDTTSNYYFRENQLYYKNGFLQGINLMISLFYHKK